MSKYMRNFGVGLGLSPYKEDGKDDDDDKKKPEVTAKEYGTGEGKGDKGWVKGLKAATTMLSHGLASVYGGTAHTPKINWGKRKDDEENLEPGDVIVDDLLDDNPEGTPDENKDPNAFNFKSRAEGDEFRAWVNENYPDEAKKIGKTGLDPSGPYNNSYIKKAWEQFGEAFNKSKESPAKFRSPVKAKKSLRTSGRGGRKAAKATRTSKQRGGFAKSKGKRGGGGRNVAGYNVQTRFQPRAARPIRGGVTTQP